MKIENFEEVEKAIERVLNTPMVLPDIEERRKILKKQKELIEKQKEMYKPNRKQLQKQFTI